MRALDPEVVNAVWAAGADGVAIMNQRLVATSAVRCVGNVLLLQGRTYSPPFVVTATWLVSSQPPAMAMPRPKRKRPIPPEVPPAPRVSSMGSIVTRIT